MIELNSEQRKQLEAIGMNVELPMPVRRLAWLITRYSEGLNTDDVARAVGLSADSARHWRSVFESEGMSVFSRYGKFIARSAAEGPRDAPEDAQAEPISIAEHQRTTPEPAPDPQSPETEAAAPEPEQEDDRPTVAPMVDAVSHLGTVAPLLFDRLAARHGLVDRHRHLLLTAVALGEVAEEQLATDTDPVWTSLLGPAAQRLNPEEKRVLAAVVEFRREPLKRSMLREAGLTRREQEEVRVLIALLRMAEALDRSQSGTTHLRGLDETGDICYLILEGPHAREDGKACVAAATMWTKITDQKVRVLLATGRPVMKPSHHLDLYDEQLKAPGLTGGDTMEQAGRKSMRYQLGQMLRREQGVFLGEEVEALHKMRVSTRRLRSAFRIFRNAFPAKDLKPFRRRLQQMGRFMGWARDLDVFLIHLLDYQQTLDDADREAFEPFAEFWRRQRFDALMELREYLHGGKYSKFVHRFHDFVSVANDPIKTGDIENWEHPANQPIRAVAPAQIYQRFSDVRAIGPHIGGATIEELHQLRIRFKHLRYTLELYREVLGNPVEDAIKTLKSVQDQLGDLQDDQRACELIDMCLRDAANNPSLTQALEPTTIEAYRETRIRRMDDIARDFQSAFREFERSDFRRQLALAVAEL